MSKFSAFMKSNKKEKQNETFAPTTSLTGEDGAPLKFEFRHITSKENEALRDDCTIDVPVTGKPNLFRPKLNTSKYLNKMICAATVVPDLYDAELQDSYGVKTPEDLMFAMIDNAGEYSELCTWMQKFQGFNKTLDDKVEEAKN
jgi:hypothetical protein